MLDVLICTVKLMNESLTQFLAHTLVLPVTSVAIVIAMVCVGHSTV